MDAARVDALIFPSWTQLPAINGDRNTQIVDEPKPASPSTPTTLNSSLAFVASSLQWPAISVPSGYLGGDLPQGLQNFSVVPGRRRGSSVTPSPMSRRRGIADRPPARRL